MRTLDGLLSAPPAATLARYQRERSRLRFGTYVGPAPDTAARAGDTILVDLDGEQVKVVSLMPASALTVGRTLALLGQEHIVIALGQLDPPTGGGSAGPAGPPGPAGPTGPQGPTGSTGATGPAGTPGEAWWSGSGAPAGATGIVGDWYLDLATGDVYEKTGASAWTLRGNIRGPQGPTGSQGPQGVKGDTGSQGPQGPTGSTGSAGTPGEKWFTGSGAPAGATGIVGDWYLDSATGDYYEKTGASAWTLRGNLRGPQGPAGSVPAYVTSLPGSPTDGLEIYYGADPANGVLWHLRYRAAASGSYKWEYLGGSDLFSAASGSQGSIGTSPVVVTGVGLTLPLAGDYLIEWRGWSQATVATALVHLMLRIGGVLNSGTMAQPPGASYVSAGPNARKLRANAIAAGAALDLTVMVNTGSAQLGETSYNQKAELSARPIRVG